MRGHYFLTPETVRTLAERAGLRVAKESSPDPGNFYLNRDYLAVLEADRIARRSGRAVRRTTRPGAESQRP